MLCSGCYNEEYHYGLGGSKECFSFKSAKVVDKIQIHINQMPPFNLENATKMMSCYNKPQWCFVSPDNLTKEGYWKS